MKIRCIIIDDEPLAREGLLDYIDKTAFLHIVGDFKNTALAKDFMQEHPVDLVFLDISMPGEGGLEFLKSLNDPPQVIFTTAHREYAAESYELDAIDYLVKPIAFERFLKAVNKVYSRNIQESNKSADKDFFFVKADGVLTKVQLEDILYVEGMKDYVKIHRKGKSTLITLLSLKHMEEQLPKEFIRVHRSFIIAGNRVEAIEGNVLKIEGYEIPIAPQLRNEVLDKITGGRFLKR